MLPVYVPTYYPAFRCTASACRHTCCVGWEIDVDEDALARYDRIIRAQAPLSDRLATAIDRKADPPCFVLDERERCPFLNRNGLCDLITAHGEDALCHICADHPRFRLVLPDRVELGLGLCCEAAAELILSQDAPVTLTALPAAAAARERHAQADPAPLDPATATLHSARTTILARLTDRSIPLSDRVAHVLTALDIHLPVSHGADWAEFLADMERLDPAWDACLQALADLSEDPARAVLDAPPPSAAHHAYPHGAEQLLGYFVYRYLAREDERLSFGLSPATLIRARVAFAVMATAIILTVARIAALPLPEAARLFSAEIEYSEENVERFLEAMEDCV